MEEDGCVVARPPTCVVVECGETSPRIAFCPEHGVTILLVRPGHREEDISSLLCSPLLQINVNLNVNAAKGVR